MTRLAALALLCAACSSPPAPEVAAAPSASAAAAPAAEPRDEALTPTEIAKRSAPAIVRLEGEGRLGTGFVVGEAGWIATNLHVVAGVTKLRAVFHDKRSYPVVELLGFDGERDVALLRIEADELPTLPLGGKVSVGDRVVAIGHPLGLSDTVSDGLISAVREVTPDLRVLQISAPIAPGSSGGPLLNERGEVIGIATAVLREGQNLNFGVPIAYLQDIMAKPSPMPLADLPRVLRPARLPSVTRNVPEHRLSLLNNCGVSEIRSLLQRIGEAIEVGAPLYNAGKLRACYHIYLGASIDMESELSPACFGPRSALKSARAQAAKASDASGAAWAMRDGFDGLIDVLGRKLGE